MNQTGRVAPRGKDVSLWLGIAIGIVFLAFLGYLYRDRFLNGRNDFVQLYAGARLSGTAGLYDPEANKRIHFEVLGRALLSIYYSRPAYYALLLRPLARLPYLEAYWIYQTLSFAAFGMFLWVWGRRHRELVIFSGLCIPLMANFVNGQDMTFALLAAVLAVEAARKNWDMLAGLLLAACSIKAHLFVLTPIVFLLHRRWRVLGGGVLGGALLMGASFLTDGLDWPRRYLKLLANPELHPGPEVMPTLRGLVYVVTGSDNAVLEIVLSLVVVAMVIWIARQTSLELGLAFAFAGGLLVGYHAYLHDCLILLFSLALVLEHSNWPALRGFMALLVTPPLFLFLMAGSPYNALVPIALAGLLALACFPRAADQKVSVPVTAA